MPEVRVELRDTTNNVVGDIEIFDSNSFPLALTYSNFDARNIKDRKGSFSKSFKIPATKSNNNLFGQIYFDGFSDTKNMKGRKDATIYVDNLPILSGQLQLTKILKGEDVEEYECVFFGDNMDWVSDLKDNSLRDLSFRLNLAHPSDPDDIVGASWSTEWQYFDPTNYWGDVPDWDINDQIGMIVYPLCSFGEGDSPKNGVMDSDFLPHIYTKSVFDKIYKTIGYNIQSTFLNSDLFKGLVMPLQLERDKDIIDQHSGIGRRTTDEELINVYHSNASSQDRSIEQTSIQSLGVFTRNFLFRGNDEDDAAIGNTGLTDGNIQDAGSGANAYTKFIAGDNGSYNVSGNIDLEITSQTPWSTTSNNNVNFSISSSVFKNGELWDEVTADGQSTGYIGSNNWDIPHNEFPFTQSFSFDETVTLNQGDYIYIRITVAHNDYAGVTPNDSGNYQVNVKSGSNLSVQASPTISMGELFKPNQLLPNKTQLDFVKGISQLFNLQFYTDAAAKTVYIEPYNHFYHPKAQALDWSDKIDYSKGVEDEFIHEIKKNIVFGYGGADGMSERFNKKNTYEYGSYKEVDSNNVFLDGTYEVKNSFFEPTFMIHEGDYVNNLSLSPLIPVYWKDYSSPRISLFHNRPDKTFDVGTRILYYRNMTATQTTSAVDSLGTITKFDYLGTNTDGEPTILDKWGRAVFIDWDNYTDTVNDGFEDVSYNLSFTSVTDGTNTMHGLYKTYYSRMIQQLKSRPRIKTLYLNLSASDIMGFDFRKLVYINGMYYRVNKISDYKPHRSETTKVELVEFLDLGSGTIVTQPNSFFM